MSVFVRAYVSMQDVWPRPLVALTLPAGSGLGQRAHVHLTVASWRCQVWRAGCLGQDEVTSPAHPAPPAAPEVLSGGAVGQRPAPGAPARVLGA